MTNRIEKLFQIRELYESAFPKDERRTFENLVQSFQKNGELSIEILSHHNITIGFIIFWQFINFVYIEHFAIDDKFRGKGLGYRWFKKLFDDINTPIILEVEPPYDQIAIKRINFYRRIGFVLHENDYRQPAYDKTKSSIELKIMSKDYPNFKNDFNNIKQTLYQHVYNASSITNQNLPE